MEAIADSWVGTAAAVDDRQAVRREQRRQLIADLESPRHNRNRYPAIASILQRDALAAGKLDQYTDLIWQLGDAGVSDHIEAEVAAALRDVWGVS